MVSLYTAGFLSLPAPPDFPGRECAVLREEEDLPFWAMLQRLKKVSE